MTYDYLVHYYNLDGDLRTYGGPGHMVDARSKQEAIDKVVAGMPPQVAKTWFSIEVRHRH